MRKDMSKVLVDTYRRDRHRARAITGCRRRFRNRLDPDGEAGLKRIGMSRDIFCHYDFKQFSDNISALIRYVRKQAGRPWNDVYSEVCELADDRRLIHWHLRLHLEFMVATHTVWMDGEVVLSACDGHQPITRGMYQAYVHPVTGLLMRA